MNVMLGSWFSQGVTTSITPWFSQKVGLILVRSMQQGYNISPCESKKLEWCILPQQ